MDELNIGGTFDFLILNALSAEPMQSLAIERRIEQQARGFLSANSKSVYTALRRMERAGWVDAEWLRGKDSNLEKVYSLTPAGKEKLNEEWDRLRSTLAQFVQEGNWPSYRFSEANRHSRN